MPRGVGADHELVGAAGPLALLQETTAKLEHPLATRVEVVDVEVEVQLLPLLL